MKKIISTITSSWHFVATFVISIFMLIRNWVPETTLSGWDNLHPEYALNVNIGRALSAVWQEYQGLGLLGGMGHAADLVRQLLLVPLTAIYGPEDVRFVLTGIMVVVGVLGACALITKVLGHARPVASQAAAFLGALVYLVNIGTVQNFYVAFEPFVWFYGLLPWLLLCLYSLLTKPTKRGYGVFFLVSILATPLGYLQTAFLVYLMVVAGLLISWIVFELRKGRAELRRNTGIARRVLAIIFAANAFWFLPVVYFTLTDVGVTVASKMNQLATPEVALSNQGMGSVKNLVSLQGYWMNLHDMNTDGSFHYLMEPWINHLNNPYIFPLYVIVGLMVLIGVLFTFRRRNPFLLGLAIVFFGFLVLLRGEYLPFGPVIAFLKQLPLFSQIFRSPFTKVIVPVSLLYSVLFASGVYGLLGLFARSKMLVATRTLSLVVWVSLLCGVLLMGLPAFSGDFYYRATRVAIPSEYSELFTFFRGESRESRIATFPAQGLWGWNFYKWNYRGSGFLWYGIEQPILDRAFDVWSRYNEQFYGVLTDAVYKDDVEGFIQIAQKYNVSYFLLDKSIIVPPSTQDSLRLETLPVFFEKAGAAKAFEKGSLVVYKLPSVEQKFVTAPARVQQIAPLNSIKHRVDPVTPSFIEVHTAGVSQFPFTDLTQEQTQSVQIENSNGVTLFSIARLIKKSEEQSFLKIPAFPTGMKLALPTTAKYTNGVISFMFAKPLTVTADTQEFASVTIPTLYVEVRPYYKQVFAKIGEVTFSLTDGEPEKVVGVLSIDPYADTQVEVFAGNPARPEESVNLQDLQFNNCWSRDAGDPFIDIQKPRVGEISFQVRDAVSCGAYRVGTVAGRGGLISIRLPYRSDDGARPHFCLVEEGSNDCLHEDIFLHTPTSTEWSDVTKLVHVPGGKTYWLVFAARTSDEPGRTWTIAYKNPQVAIYSLQSDFTLKRDAWRELREEKQVLIPEKASEIALNTTSVSSVFSHSMWQRAYAYNCDILQRGQVQKIVGESTTTYTAQERGSICDYLQLPNVSTDEDYLVGISGTNNTGRGAKLYLYNEQAKHIDLETLTPNGNFYSLYSLLGNSRVQGTAPFTLNLEITSFGGELAKSHINTLEVFPLPLKWLSQVSIKKQNEPEVITNGVSVLSSRKYGTFLYVVSANNLSAQQGVIRLSQGYDRGWIALSGLQILTHARADGWANAWIVPGSSSRTIYLFYLPQLIQFIGFGFIAAALCVPLRRVFKQKINRR